MPAGPSSRPPGPPQAELDPGVLAAVAAGAGMLVEEAVLEGVALCGAAPAGLDARFVAVQRSRVTASLAGARLADAALGDCVVDGADLANVHAPRAALQRCALRATRLTGATLSDGRLQDVALTECRADLVSFAGARLDRVLLADCDLREAVFDEAQLRDVRFERCVLAGASLHRVRLQRVELAGCDLTGLRSVADLRGAAMPWPDVVANAGALAEAAGIRVLD